MKSTSVAAANSPIRLTWRQAIAVSGSVLARAVQGGQTLGWLSPAQEGRGGPVHG